MRTIKFNEQKIIVREMNNNLKPTENYIYSYIYIQNGTMPNYANSKIYAIKSHQTDKVFIGATTQKLCKRIHNHRGDYDEKKYFNVSGDTLWKSFYDVVQFPDNYIELIEEYKCYSKS